MAGVAPANLLAERVIFKVIHAVSITPPAIEFLLVIKCKKLRVCKHGGQRGWLLICGITIDLVISFTKP